MRSNNIEKFYLAGEIYDGDFFLAKSLDGGQTWSKIDPPNSHFKKYFVVNDIWLDEINENKMIIGISANGPPKSEDFSTGGLYLTEDDGQTWTELYKGEVNLVDVDNSTPRNIYFGTKFGLMRLPDTTTVTAIDKAPAPANDYYLSQNYPNPFNPSTIIEYTIPRSTEYYSVLQVTFRVYDILGSEVATLVNKHQAPGNYKVVFNASSPANGTGLHGGSHLASGVYFYKLTAGNYSQTKKMILLQ
jgi:hypothetical protein